MKKKNTASDIYPHIYTPKAKVLQIYIDKRSVSLYYYVEVYSQIMHDFCICADISVKGKGFDGFPKHQRHGLTAVCAPPCQLRTRRYFRGRVCFILILMFTPGSFFTLCVTKALPRISRGCEIAATNTRSGLT